MTIERLDYTQLILCACGCGKTLSKYRYHHGQYIERKYLSGHNTGNQEGSNNRNYKGGWIQRGYHRRGRKNNLVHRQMYEKYYKCCLLPWIDIHHKDGNKLNNDILNLEALPHSKHMLLEWKKRKNLLDS